MAAGNFTLYQANLDDIRIADLVGATIKLSLHTSAYTPNVGTGGHSLASNLTNELPTGGGYTAGGITLASPTKTAVTGGYKFSTANAQWTATGSGIPTWRYAVLRVDGTLGGKVNPIIGAAGISAFPMAARVCQRVAQEEDFENFLLMHAMGANAAGQVASVVAGGVVLALMGTA